MVSRTDSMKRTTLPLEPPREDLPPGPTWKCPECGTSLRTNEHHSASRHVVLFINQQPILYTE